MRIKPTTKISVYWKSLHLRRITSAYLRILHQHGHEIKSIAGRALLTWCQHCGDPILEGEKYLLCEDANLCRRCTPGKRELAKMRKEAKT